MAARAAVGDLIGSPTWLRILAVFGFVVGLILLRMSGLESRQIGTSEPATLEVMRLFPAFVLGPSFIVFGISWIEDPAVRRRTAATVWAGLLMIPIDILLGRLPAPVRTGV